MTGTPSGYRDLDRLTSGFQPGNLIIVAARPSMGKSALALCMAANLAVRHGVPVGLFTLEMSKAEVTQRLMCSEAKVESQRLRTGKLAPDDWPRLTAACDKLAKAPIYVDDTGSINMMEIRSKARRLKSRQPDLGLVVVDYLQLMSSAGNAENRVQEVSQISRSLKVLARDLEVPIVALSQLSRAVEQRTDKRPILSDLRESGSIEQDADLVMFIYRDEYYNEESDQQGLAEVILAKHRNGPTDSVKLVVPQALREVRRPGGCLTTGVKEVPDGGRTDRWSRSPLGRRRSPRSASSAASSTEAPAGPARRSQDASTSTSATARSSAGAAIPSGSNARHRAKRPRGRRRSAKPIRAHAAYSFREPWPQPGAKPQVGPGSGAPSAPGSPLPRRRYDLAGATGTIGRCPRP